MRGVVNPGLREECVRLRVEERLSLREIHERTEASKGSLSSWLKGYPLTEEELKQRSTLSTRYVTPKKDRGEESKLHRALDVNTFDRRQKMKIAESAVLFRLCCYGFNAFKPAFDGDRVDWVVQTHSRLLKVQVKWAKRAVVGLPVIPLTCVEGNVTRRYSPADFHFIVGYDFFSDTAYVYSYEETVSCQTAISVTPDAAENWHKLT